jgi:hypothetical protein
MLTTQHEAQEQTKREIALTERWEKPAMRQHEAQSLFVYHPARFKFNPSPRRTGKTELVKRSAVLTLIQDLGWPAKIAIAAPTYTRAKDIYFEDIRALIPKRWIKRIKESTQEIEFRTHWGAAIRLFGMAKPQIVEGVPWDRFYGDEMADYPPRCFETHIRPALATPERPGSAWFVGVPDEYGPNQAEYEKYWELGLRWPEKPDYCSFWWPADGIADEKELQDLAEGMDRVLYLQEMGGQFVRTGGLAFPTLSPLNVDPHYSEYSPFLPIDHTLDFGSACAASLIAQSYGDQVWIMNEIDLVSGSTQSAAEAFMHMCGEMGFSMINGMRVFGDAAGRTPNQVTGHSDYELLREMYSQFNPQFLNLIGNPNIGDTVNVVRAKMCDWRGRVTLFIHPRCKGLIQELKEAKWPATDNLKQFHRLAALRYYLYALFSASNQGHGVVSIGRATLTQDKRVSSRYN